VTAEDGRVVIPAGATVTFTIVAIGPATNTAATDGTIELRATGIVVDGESRALDAQVTFVEHSLKGQGVGASEVTKVGVGTAAGAILGRVIGGKTGTVVGAAAGAAAGTAVAVKSADRDLVVAVGARIKLVLKSALVSGS
jgi:predicted GNAT family acetyltransferase